jgi:hypothetical protein
VRQLLWHRHRMVQTRTRTMNQLQAAALNEGLRYKKRLWRENGRQQLESLPLAPSASRRRRDLLEVLDRIDPTIAELTRAIEQQAEKCPEAQRLMTHPGVGALTALVLVLIVGEAERFGWASRSPAILVWFRRKIPAESAADWDTSARSARVSTLEKNLTAPTLLEMAIFRHYPSSMCKIEHFFCAGECIINKL